MPNLKDIRRRIRSVKNMQQITKAMKMVSAARLRRAQERVTAARPYANTMTHVLENLSEPEKLGHLIAGAFVATLWGVLSANVFFLPIASRLKRLGELEVARMEVVIEGVLAIQAGANPRVVAAKLAALLPAHEQLEAQAA